MSGGASRRVAADEGGVRLDRWFRRHYPGLSHGNLERLLRTGQVRVNGGRVRSGERLEPGQVIRVPPLPEEESAAPPPPPPVSRVDRAFMRGLVLHCDDSVIVLNKPPGLAVQGGSGTVRHLDGMLEALCFGADRPRLVHRLDRDTSGVLVLARTVASAGHLAESLRDRRARKIYWGLTAGVPKPSEGIIKEAVSRRPDGGKRQPPRAAVTRYATVDRAGRLTWVAFMPETGRTHQIRAHACVLKTPIAGDGKYGGRAAHPGGGIDKRMHLHARSLEIPHPDGGVLDIRAPLPPHMAACWELLGFDPAAGDASDGVARMALAQ